MLSWDACIAAWHSWWFQSAVLFWDVKTPIIMPKRRGSPFLVFSLCQYEWEHLQASNDSKAQEGRVHVPLTEECNTRIPTHDMTSCMSWYAVLPAVANKWRTYWVQHEWQHMQLNCWQQSWQNWALRSIAHQWFAVHKQEAAHAHSDGKHQKGLSSPGSMQEPSLDRRIHTHHTVVCVLTVAGRRRRLCSEGWCSLGFNHPKASSLGFNH